MYYFSPSRLVFNKTNKIWNDGVALSDTRYDELVGELEDGRELYADNQGNPLTRLSANPPAPVPIAKLYHSILSDMNNEYEMAVAYLKQSYPLSEAITWSVQREEAKIVLAWLEADETRVIGDFPRSLAPFLYDLAAQRTAGGIPGGLLELAQRVLFNDSQFSPAMATITARRHIAEKALLAAVDANDKVALKNVHWDFDLT